MKDLKDYKADIHKCSKCGLCQAECPVYKLTGNDCAVSRGQLIMLNGVLKGDLEMNSDINKYLDLCLKCGKCEEFCPSGIKVVDIIVTAKSEYLKKHPNIKKFLTNERKILFKYIPQFCKLFNRKIKSKSFNKKVLYFGGCKENIKTNNSLVKLLNSMEIEVITPNYNCCGISAYTHGDLDAFKNSILGFINITKKYNINEIITTCASCEKTLKDYVRLIDNEELKEYLSSLKITNIYEYIYEKKHIFKLKRKTTATYHKPCHCTHFQEVEWLLNNIENLEYREMRGFDECCGLESIKQFKNIKQFIELYQTKRKNIKDTKTKNILTNCFGCEVGLKTYSLGQYKVHDLLEFISKNA